MNAKKPFVLESRVLTTQTGKRKVVVKKAIAWWLVDMQIASSSWLSMERWLWN